MSRWLFLAASLLLTISPLAATAEENWPAWRGPAGIGSAEGAGYPVELDPAAAAWKVDLPGLGCSTPVVWGDSVFLTCGVEGVDALVCYDWKSGEQRWIQKLGAEVEGKHRNGSGSNPSAATDGRHVVALYKSGELACFTGDGNPLWNHNLAKEYGEITLWWDYGSSPVIAGGRAIVAVMHAGESYLAAFDLDSGELAWKQDRTYERPQEADQSYASPQLVQQDGRSVLVVFGADHLTGHDVADGRRLWDVGGFNPQNQTYWRVIASAAAADGVAVIPYGRGGMLAGVRLPAEGANIEDDQGWTWKKTDLGADVPTPCIAEGRAFVLSDDGRLACLDPSTGEPHWQAALPKNRHKYYASPTVAGDQLYAAREDGTVFVGRVGEKFEQLAENKFDEQLIASPVPLRGSLLVRTADHLYRFGPSTAGDGG